MTYLDTRRGLPRGGLIAIGLLVLAVSAAAVGKPTLADEREVDQVVDDVVTLVKRGHLSLQRVQSRGDMRVGPFSERSIEIGLTGSFGDFKRYLADVDRMHHIVRFHDMTITRGTDYGRNGRPGVPIPGSCESSIRRGTIPSRTPRARRLIRHRHARACRSSWSSTSGASIMRSLRIRPVRPLSMPTPSF